MILDQLTNLRGISTKADKAYLLDEIAKKGKFYSELLNIIFDKDVRFFVDIKKVSESLSSFNAIQLKSDEELDEELFNLLKRLASEEIRGNIGVQKCIDFADQLETHEQEMFLDILENKTRLGIGATDINKLCKTFSIEQFEVMFAKRLDKIKKFNWNQRWCIQPKIDGMRCIGIKAPGEGIKFYTRTGKDITSLRELENQININVPAEGAFVLDGEIESGSSLEETGAIRRKKEQVGDAIYTIFGIYNYTEWISKNHTETYEDIYEHARQFPDYYNLPNIRVIPSYLIFPKSEEDFHHLVNKYYQGFLDHNYEGAVLKTIDHIYDPSAGTRRSNNWVKIKPEETTEGKIISIEEGDGEHQGLLGKFNVKWLDKEFEVAPGKLNHKARKYIMEHPDEYIGKEVEFRYQLLSIYGVPRHAYALKVRDE